jgi:hypothetical protein
MRRGSHIDNVLRGPGYPTPIKKVELPHDNLTKIKREYAASGALRSNTRLGWIRK